jgi:hypothetical protein
LLGAGDVVIEPRQSRNAHGFDAIPEGQAAGLAAAVDFLGQQFMDNTGAETAFKGDAWFFSAVPQIAALGGTIETPLAIRAGIADRLVQQFAAAITFVGDVEAAGSDVIGFF